MITRPAISQAGNERSRLRSGARILERRRGQRRESLPIDTYRQSSRVVVSLSKLLERPPIFRLL